jgi:hypothetical protein
MSKRAASNEPINTETVADVEFPTPTANDATQATSIPVGKDGRPQITDVAFHAKDVEDRTTPLPLDKNGDVQITDVEFPMPRVDGAPDPSEAAAANPDD